MLVTRTVPYSYIHIHPIHSFFQLQKNSSHPSPKYTRCHFHYVSDTHSAITIFHHRVQMTGYTFLLSCLCLSIHDILPLLSPTHQHAPHGLLHRTHDYIISSSQYIDTDQPDSLLTLFFWLCCSKPVSVTIFFFVVVHLKLLQELALKCGYNVNARLASSFSSLPIM